MKFIEKLALSISIGLLISIIDLILITFYFFLKYDSLNSLRPLGYVFFVIPIWIVLSMTVVLIRTNLLAHINLLTKKVIGIACVVILILIAIPILFIESPNFNDNCETYGRLACFVGLVLMIFGINTKSSNSKKLNNDFLR